MSFPSITVYDAGPGGIPTTINPRELGDRITSYDDSLANEFGCQALRCTLRAPSIEEATYWADQLMAGVVVGTPDARPRFAGFLFEVTVTITTPKRSIKLGRSLGDMANSLIVRWSNTDGTQGTELVEHAASIARYGRKQQVLNESGASAAVALNRAQSILAEKAWPKNKPPESSAGGAPGITVELVFHGWADTLDWLVTSNEATTERATTAQVIDLLAQYNAINAFFDLSKNRVRVVGPSAPEAIAADTTYAKRIAQLLSYGTNAQERIAWGVYADRGLLIERAASATPTTITYVESLDDKELRDTNGNVVRPEDWRPDAMVRVDILETGIPSDAVTALSRKYIKRVTLRAGQDGVLSGGMEAEDVSKLAELLSKPAGGGTSSRSSAIESRFGDLAGLYAGSTWNPTRYDSALGAWKPTAGGTGMNDPDAWSGGAGGVLTPIHGGTGINNGPGGTIDTGGAPITNTGGGPIDLGTGDGIGGALPPGSTPTNVITSRGTAGQVIQWGLSGDTLIDSGMALDMAGAATGAILTLLPSGKWGPTPPGAGVLTGAGTSGALAKWATAGSLTDAIAGVDYAAASHTHDASAIVSGIMAPARLGSGTPSATTYLRGDGTWATITASGSAAPADATYIVQTSNSTLSNEFALASLATGLLKNTTTTGVLSIATAGVDYAAASHTHTSTSISDFAEAVDDRVAALLIAGANVTLTYDDIANTLTIDVTSGTGTIGGSGTTGSLAKWSNSSTLTNAVAGTDYAAASHTHAAADIVSGIISTSRLGSGTANNTTYLRGDGTWATITTSGSAAPIDATYIVQTANGTLSNEFALGSLATGLLKNTTTTGVLSIATAGVDYAAASHTHDVTEITNAAANDHSFIVRQASAGLTNEFALGSLATGILKNTTSTGVPTIAVAGVDYAAANHTHDGSDIVSGFVPLARLGNATPSNQTYLRGDQVWAMLNADHIAAGTVNIGNGGTGATTAAGALAALGAAPSAATYIVRTASGGLGNEFVLGNLATGLLKNTTSTGVLSIAVAGTDYAAASHTHAASAIVSGILATARLGSGTADSTTFLRGDSTWATFAGVTGSGAASRVAYWSGAGSLTSSANLTFDGTSFKLATDGHAIGTTSPRASTTVTIEGANTSSGNFALYVRNGSGAGIFSVQNNSVVAIETGPLWIDGAAVLSGRAPGWQIPGGTQTRTTYNVATVTLQQLAERVAALINDLHANGGQHLLLGP